MTTNKKTTVTELLSRVLNDVDLVMGRSPQFAHPDMPPCVLLTDKEWQALKTYVRLFRGKEEELLNL